MSSSSKFHNTTLIISAIKWAFDFLLHQSFSFGHSSCINLNLLEKLDSHSTRCNSVGSANECAVCLCMIEEGDETSELKCTHVFHRVCLDRWVGYGHWTCPLCRNYLNYFPTIFNNYGGAHQAQVVAFNFCDVRSSDKDNWWLR